MSYAWPTFEYHRNQYAYGLGHYPRPDNALPLEYSLGEFGQAIDNFASTVGINSDRRAKLDYIGHKIPFVSDVLEARDSWNFMNDYLSNRGMNWSQVKYGGHNPTAGVGTSTAFWYLSQNIHDLYD